MQKESAPLVQTEEQPATYSTFVKDQALKLLDDYSLATGRKWQAICSEILRVTETENSDFAPLLTRQDLESWAARRSTLGDHKFKIVYAFLTHPDTLERPEFAKANDLMSFGRLERVGGSFSDFFDDHKRSTYITQNPLSHNIDEQDLSHRIKGFEGNFTGTLDDQDYCLSLQQFRDQPFFITHFFSWPTNGYGELTDWDIERFSGFCTIGNMVRLHTKGVIISTVRDMYMVPKTDPDQDQINTINLVLHSLMFNAVEAVTFDKFKTQQQKLNYIDPTTHNLVLHRTSDAQLSEFIDQFRWNIVL